MKQNTKIIHYSVALLVSTMVPTISQASGFALIEMNASGQGNAYAGAAAHTPNASTIYFNPAGMMKLEGEQIVFAGHFISPQASFTDNGSAIAPGAGGAPLTGGDDDGGSNAFVPNFYWSKPLDNTMSFGVGMNSPFGLVTEYSDTWKGRYHAILSDLATVNINPSLAYRVNDSMSVGGGLNFILGAVELSSAIDFGTLSATSPQNADGKATLEGDNYDDISIGFNLGLLYKLSSQTDLGVAYRSEVDMKMEGDADFTVPAAFGAAFSPAFTDTGLKAEVSLPASLSLSMAHKADKITYLADITWTGWSSFKELRIKYDNPAQPDSVTTEDWDDTFRYSLGFDYQYASDMILRAGVALDESPVPSAERRTPRLPGNDRTWLSFGVTYLLNKETSIDIGYSHLFIKDAKTDNTLESSIPALNATLTGEYEADVDIISAQLNWNLM